MGAKDIFTNPQFLTCTISSSACSSITKTMRDNNNLVGVVVQSSKLEQQHGSNLLLDDEWHQKYVFIIGLLRKPHSLLVKDSLSRERDKLTEKLKAYQLERNLVRDNIAKNIQPGIENNVHPSLSAQIKHLDLMCITLERQIDVLDNVDQALPTTDNIYSGEPDSLDGTSSEIILKDELDSLPGDPQNNDNCTTKVRKAPGSNFQLTINGRSPLDAFAMLHFERCAHRETSKELNQLKKKYEVLRDEFDSGEGLSQTTSLLFSCINGELEDEDIFNNHLTIEDRRGELSIGTDGSHSRLSEEVRLKDMTINQLRSRVLHLEKARMDKVPLDAAREIARLHTTLVQLERVRDELTLQNFTLKSKLAELSIRISDSTTYRLERPLNNENNQDNRNENYNNLNNNVTRMTTLLRSSPDDGLPQEDMMIVGIGRSMSVTSDDMKLRRKSTYKIAHNIETNVELKQLRALINDLHTKELEAQRKYFHVETELTNLKNQLADECTGRIEAERSVRSLEQHLEDSQKRLEVTENCYLTRDDECTALKLDLETLNEENTRLKDDWNILHTKVEKEQSKSFEKLSKFEKEIGSILDQNRILLEDFNRERVLRKRYHNIVEDLKGKIRVFCRIRPLSKNEKPTEVVAKCCDPYTVVIETPKGLKEFQFDRVFLPDESQEEIFSDTRNLIQSAFDGYNVCICAYGQTGSGKTYTILGDEIHPGIAPRTFTEIFSTVKEMSQSHETFVSFYVLELYNDKLIDLLNPVSSLSLSASDSPDTNKLEIRRDRRGTVWVSGARVLPAEDSFSLEKSFRHALGARHTAATRMNDRSSRSHLIVGLLIETTSRVNGQTTRGKISLVDLAGSERTGKSGVSADTLREANAINKSLSAFGDVINALTTDQSFVPYRNNKLTLLMQDSLGGNAKTLMFVNISPSNYNLEETVVSLTYATRVKQVTNGATRNAESKEVARLRQIINRLKRGENCSVDEDTL